MASEVAIPDTALASDTASLKRSLESEEAEEAPHTEAGTNGTNGTNGTSEHAEPAKESPAPAIQTMPPKKKLRTITEMELDNLGMLGEQDFTNEDVKHPPWTDISRKLWKEKKNMHDNKYASKWMRWWFEEHKGMPCEPKKLSMNAYFLFNRLKSAELGLGINKASGKKISGMWKSASPEEQAKFHEQHEKNMELFDKETAEYEDAMVEWRKEKPPRTDKQPSCKCRFCVED